MNPATLISLGRIGIGTAAVVRPALVAGIITPGQPAGGTPVLTQWFGSREIAIGLATLVSRGAARRTMVLIGMGVDGADAATTYAAIGRQEIPRASGMATVAVAGAAVVAGALGLRLNKHTEFDLVAAPG